MGNDLSIFFCLSRFCMITFLHVDVVVSNLMASKMSVPDIPGMVMRWMLLPDETHVQISP